MSEIKLLHPRTKETIDLSFFISITGTAALNLWRRLVLREVHLLNELEEGYPHAVAAVDRICIGRQRWCILHIENDGSDMNFLIENALFQSLKNYLSVWGGKVCFDLYKAEH